MAGRLMRVRMDDCSKCNGKGYLVNRKKVLRRCPKCLGRGELDWVENVVGPNRERGFPGLDALVQRYYQDPDSTMLYDYKDIQWK
jgi:hypothetical protein